MDIFSRLEGRLKGDYGGRFFSIVLEQLFWAEPDLLLSVFPSLNKDRERWKKLKTAIKNKEVDTLQIEVPFEGEEKNRRADFYLLLNGELVAIAEVKYEDHKGGGVRKQINDNIKEAKRHRDACFTYLTLHPSPLDIRTLVEKGGGHQKNAKFCARTYRDVYDAAKRLSRKKNNEVVKSFCAYMEEKFRMYKDDLGDGAVKKLTYLMLRGLYVKHAHGFGKHQTEENSFGAFDIARDLMSNVQSVADYIHDACPKIFCQRPRPFFSFEPEFSLKKVAKAITTADCNGEESLCFNREDRSGGYFSVGSGGKLLLDDNQYLYINFGQHFYLDMKEKNVKAATYAEVWGKNVNSENAESLYKEFNPKKKEKPFRTQVLKNLKTAINQAGQNKRCAKVLEALKKLQ